MFDVQMGTYHQREYEGYRSARKDMERVLGSSNYEPEDTCLSYRHLFDVDRNSMSTRFDHLLSRRAVVLTQTRFQEWHDDCGLTLFLSQRKWKSFLHWWISSSMILKESVCPWKLPKLVTRGQRRFRGKLISQSIYAGCS